MQRVVILFHRATVVRILNENLLADIQLSELVTVEFRNGKRRKIVDDSAQARFEGFVNKSLSVGGASGGF